MIRHIKILGRAIEPFLLHKYQQQTAENEKTIVVLFDCVHKARHIINMCAHIFRHHFENAFL